MQKIIRAVLFVIVFIVQLNSLFFVVVAIYKSVEAYIILAQGRLAERPGLLIAESLDSFMVALFFIIFSFGISKLFLPRSSVWTSFDFPWLKVENFSQLKFIMWEVLLTTIFLDFVVRIINVQGHYEWNLLILPASILLLSVSYKLFKQSH